MLSIASDTNTEVPLRASPIPAAEYVRMSTDHQQYSTANQSQAIHEYAARHGFKIAKTYEDSGKSGLNLDDRDALKQLIDDVQSGAVETNGMGSALPWLLGTAAYASPSLRLLRTLLR